MSMTNASSIGPDDLFAVEHDLAVVIAHDNESPLGIAVQPVLDFLGMQRRVERVVRVKKRDAIDVRADLLGGIDDAKHERAAAAVTGERDLRFVIAKLLTPLIDQLPDFHIGIGNVLAKRRPAKARRLGNHEHDPLVWFDRSDQPGLGGDVLAVVVPVEVWRHLPAHGVFQRVSVWAGENDQSRCLGWLAFVIERRVHIHANFVFERERGGRLVKLS
jgi:hypothetical protein